MGVVVGLALIACDAAVVSFFAKQPVLACSEQQMPLLLSFCENANGFGV